MIVKRVMAPVIGTKAIAIALLALLGLAGCAIQTPAIARSPTLRLSEVATQGDATRRASLRLVIDGLTADARGEGQRARGSYARALQLDSGNPYAYLALARHHADAGEASLVVQHLARADDLFSPAQRASPRVEVHLIGLRGVALRLEGRSAEADRLLARAARSAPSVWGDARLGAEELR